MDSTLIAGIIGGLSTIIAAYITYKATKGGISKDTNLQFETTDYIKHVRSHDLSLDGIRQAFTYSNTIEELSSRLKALSNSRITCEYFDPFLMRTTFLTPINNARTTLNVKQFNSSGLVTD